MGGFDVVVVGGRCAGAPLATMLAEHGLRVCLVDKAKFPSDTLSTHVIQPRGVGVLDRLGVLDAALAAGGVPLTRFTLVIEGARISTGIDPDLLGSTALSVRRVTLDHLLVEAAVAAGAEVRTGTRANGLIWRDGRVAGVETADGPLHARLVVGADGRGSTVANQARAGEYHVAPAARMFAWAYLEGVSELEGHLRLGWMGELTYVACPTDAGLYMAAVCPPLELKEKFLADREGSFMAGIEAWSELAELLEGSSRVGSIRLMTNWRGYFRRAAGPGWALLGDAGNFKDPSPAQGIADALTQAERLAEGVVAGFGDGASLDEELNHWWRWRDDDAYEMHWLAADIGAVEPTPPLAAQFLQDTAADQEASKALLRVLNHDIPPTQLFTPRRVGRAVARVAREQPGQIPAMAKEVVKTAHMGVSRSSRRYRGARAVKKGRVPQV